MKIQSKFFAAAAILILALSVQLRAQYVLTEVAEVYIPNASNCNNTYGTYDLQHWTSDSTYGWVSVVGNTIQYCIDIDSGEIYETTTDNEWLDGARFIGSSLDNPKLVAFDFFNYDIQWDFLIFRYVNAHTGEIIEPDNIFSYCACNNVVDRSLSLKIPRAWPPPPNQNSFLIANCQAFATCHLPGAYDTDGHYGHGALFNLNEEMNSIIVGLSCIFPFSRYDSLEFATTDYSHSRSYMWGEPAFSETSWKNIGSYSAATDSHYITTLCETDSVGVNCGHPASVVAQIDLDGTKRALLEGYCYLADENNQFSELWYNQDLRYGRIQSATLVEGEDERFVKDYGNCFNVYNASTGEFIGSTTHFEGQFQYLIKLQDRVTEFVTLDDDNDIVRVYKPGNAILLTLHVLPASNSLQLNWYPVTGASSYTVWLRHPPPMTGPYFAGTTTDTTLTIPIPEESVGYFNVETDY